jgi:hypothetical protein
MASIFFIASNFQPLPPSRTGGLPVPATVLLFAKGPSTPCANFERSNPWREMRRILSLSGRVVPQRMQESAHYVSKCLFCMHTAGLRHRSGAALLVFRIIAKSLRFSQGQREG